MSEVAIAYVPVDELRFNPRNPKEHSTDELAASIRRFGFVAPLIADEATGRVVAGHGRAEALAQMRDGGEEPPERVRVDEQGRWLVPVLTGVSFKNPHEAEAYLVADNRLTERGGWNDGLLAALLDDLRSNDLIEGIGYSDDDITKLIEKQNVHPPEEFQSFDVDVKVDYRCPKCSYEWSGSPK